MATRQRTSQNSVYSGFFEFLKKYWYLVLGLIFAVPYVLKYLKFSQVSNAKQEIEQDVKLALAQNASPELQQSALDAITTRKDLQNIARNVLEAFHIGTDYSWSDWSYYYENDEDAFKELKKINYPTSRDLIGKCYWQLSGGRNFMADVKKYLDKKYLNQLPLFR